MGLFGPTKKRAELSEALRSLAVAFNSDVNGNAGYFDAMVASSKDRIERLTVEARAENPKGVGTAKSQARSVMWTLLTANPNTSMKDGSPADRALQRFYTRLDELVPS